jgi:putative hydrolase of HD superfamily
MNVNRTLDCLAELHSLTKLPRIGWILAGVKDAETVSDHCFETAVIAYILSRHIGERVDLGKVLAMALFHEVGEVRLSDLPRRSSPYVRAFKRNAELEICRDVLDGVAEDVIPLLEEMHEQQTLEARLVEAAEELQIILTALHYAKENQGDTTEYRRDARRYDSLGIDPAKQLANVIERKLGEYLGIGRTGNWAISGAPAPHSRIAAMVLDLGSDEQHHHTESGDDVLMIYKARTRTGV